MLRHEIQGPDRALIVLTAIALFAGVLLTRAGEKEAYTKTQTWTESYSATPADIQIVPDSNIDIQGAGTGDWRYEVQLLDASDNVIQITLPGEKPRSEMAVTATIGNVKAGLSAAGVADPTAFLLTLQKALLKVAKAKLPQ